MSGIQFVINAQGERIAVIIPFNEYEDLLDKRHLDLEVTDDYKSMVDIMIQGENDGLAQHVSLVDIKKRFS